MRRSWTGIFPLAVVAALLAAGCQRAPTQAAKPEYKVAFIGALTGDYAMLVVGARDGAKLAIDEANAKGDLPVKLVLQEEDSQGDKDKAVPIAQKLAGDDKVVAVIGPAFSGESFAANPILQAAGIPQVTPSATNPGLAQQGWKAWFRGVGNDNSQGGPTPDVILTYLKGKKVFLAHDKGAYGEGLATIVRDGLKTAAPDSVMGFEGVDPGKSDYSPLATKIAQSAADVFYWGAYDKEGALILKQARERGWKGTYVGADGSKSNTFIETAGDAAEGAIVTCPCADPTASKDPVAQKFVTDAKAKGYDPGRIYSGEGYDAALVIIEAIRKAGAPGADIKEYRRKVAENIRAAKGLKGVTKTYEFQANGELAPSSVAIYLYKVENKKWVLLGRVDELVK